MLKKILSISGKPGLFKLISYGKNLIVVENISTKKRNPAYNTDKIISLGDIAIYTENGEVQLSEVFDKIFKKYNGEILDSKALNNEKALRDFFEEILEDYDKERVYANDIKKVITWYNLLLEAGMTDFQEKKEENEDSEEKAAETEKEENK